jgi:hypothetical protein
MIAKNVANRLKTRHGITCYIDDIDSRLKAVTPQQLTKMLVDMVNKCTNLLAVVTKNTEGSWWVPYEIGVAKQAPRVISSMTNLSDKELPGYLMEWPRLRGDDAIDKYARLYKTQQKLLEENILKKHASFSNQQTSVESFERVLKLQLGQ